MNNVEILKKYRVDIKNEEELNIYVSILKETGLDHRIFSNPNAFGGLKQGMLWYNSILNMWLLSTDVADDAISLAQLLVYLYKPELVPVETFDVIGKLETVEEFLTASKVLTQDDKDFIMELLKANTEDWIQYLDDAKC